MQLGIMDVEPAGHFHLCSPVVESTPWISSHCFYVSISSYAAELLPFIQAT